MLSQWHFGHLPTPNGFNACCILLCGPLTKTTFTHRGFTGENVYPNSSLIIFEDTLSSIPFFTYELLHSLVLLMIELGFLGISIMKMYVFLFFYKTLGHVGGNNWRRKLTTFLLIYQIIDLRLSSENHFFK